ncbi:MAG: LacI family DNA-binding transcriptional regulator, partial [Wenzhouxiangellaceae bacterium]
MSGRRPRNVVTLDDLARHAGVSKSTVSLVLRGSLLPASATRERVLEAVKALGYVYN